MCSQNFGTWSKDVRKTILVTICLEDVTTDEHRDFTHVNDFPYDMCQVNEVLELMQPH